IALADVDYRQHALTGHVAAQVLPHHTQLGLRAQVRLVGDVRRDDDVARLPQRVIGRQRLGIRDVEPGASDLAAIERIDERRGDYTATARDVDEVGGRFHLREERRVEDAGGLRRERRGVHDEVRFCGQLRQLIRQADVAYEVRAGAAAGARRGDFHAERVRALRDLAADAAETDHEHGLAVDDRHAPPGRRPAAPFAALLLVEVTVDAA